MTRRKPRERSIPHERAVVGLEVVYHGVMLVGYCLLYYIPPILRLVGAIVDGKRIEEARAFRKARQKALGDERDMRIRVPRSDGGHHRHGHHKVAKCTVLYDEDVLFFFHARSLAFSRKVPLPARRKLRGRRSGGVPGRGRSPSRARAERRRIFSKAWIPFRP